MTAQPDIGTAENRVDGTMKVTGQAIYAAEYHVRDLLYGVVVSAGITRGQLTSIDTSEARQVDGVVEVLTHENRPHVPWYVTDEDDSDASSKQPFRPLGNRNIMFAGQPIALVVGISFEAARQAAMLVRASYQEASHNTCLETALPLRLTPEEKKKGNIIKGDVAAACATATARVNQRYSLAMEHHQPMEMHATTVEWHGDGTVTLYDKNQGSQHAQEQLTQAFGYTAETLKVINPFVGGAFGSGLGAAYQAYLAMLAAIMLQRSVRVMLTRQQMFSHVHRPACIEDVSLACDTASKLTAIALQATTSTSQSENYTENIVGWGPTTYPCDNIRLDYAVAAIDTPTPGNMRAPGAATGMTLFESAMDELAYANKIDPLALRLVNYSDTHGLTALPYTSKALKEAYREGAARFGWSNRSPEPRSMREGKELLGWGMATGIWEALVFKASARATLDKQGVLTIASAASDIGTGTYTIMAQIAAGVLGLTLDRVNVSLGDSSLPQAGVAGGSSMATSVGAAVRRACGKLAQELFETVSQSKDNPLGTLRFEDVEFCEGNIRLRTDPSRFISYQDIVARSDACSLHGEGSVDPATDSTSAKAKNTHSALFAEVRVDEELGVVRVTRLTLAVAAGRIINPKTARSQILGGAVMGIGMALHEESMFDHRLGRIMNHNFAEYHIPCHADVYDIDVLFVQEPDSEMSPLGAKGVGEIGSVGTAAAIANAVYHATGKRIRDLPITLDKLL
ncbi:xanthine dehydrogenase family protein molybdopterin-binding subunit [Paenalcaligenes niemegkensis]|uniref:xanthine dehydrogenase family protein molybdopterin-binding subunit n=1 Tax=Paenalcaligenes niemegkensis TaxID=2895469 RepID=UPI001EE8B73D|nr:xanthine dehydrogenase family protein molybdopterin-binding subunit [Paenalcaligenes niemegkensis]MCQ9616626.1 xanthine dehydrogenase family protein molybdopterin-binding subunit [Paenalcaligenes niemegkensis]